MLFQCISRSNFLSSTPSFLIKSVDSPPWFWWMAFHIDWNIWIVIPVGSCSFSIVFFFKVTDDGAFTPSASTADFAVMHIFSFPEVFMMMKLLLFFQWYNWMVSQSKLLFSVFPIWLSRSWSLCNAVTYSWNTKSFSASQRVDARRPKFSTVGKNHYYPLLMCISCYYWSQTPSLTVITSFSVHSVTVSPKLAF